MKIDNGKQRKIQAKYRELQNEDNKKDNITEKIAIVFSLLFLFKKQTSL